MGAPHVVLTPLRHNGQDYAPGATVDLETKDAEGLLASGVVQTLEALKAAEGVPTLGDMTKAKIVQYATDTYGVELDPGDTKATLLKAVQELEAKAQEPQA